MDVDEGRRQRERERQDTPPRETPEETEAQARLARRRSLQRERIRELCALQVAEEREDRLARRRERERERRASESGAEREIRLARRRVRARARISSETQEETEARLEQHRLAQQQSRARETQEGMEARRECNRLNMRPTQSHTQLDHPFLQQPVVHSKMKRFHSRLTSLQFSKCITCLEHFPGLKKREGECIRCFGDKHNPKMYSSSNNMNPGPVPPELMVCQCVACIFVELGVIKLL